MLASKGGIHGSIEEPASDCGSTQAVLSDQMTQRLLGFDLEEVGQFRGVVAVGGSLDEGFHGVYQRAVTREPDAFVRPQPTSIKARDFLKRVEASAMAVAGEITEVLQLAEDGEIDRGAEDPLELGQLGNLVAEQVAAEDCRVKSDGSHYVRIPTRGSFL